MHAGLCAREMSYKYNCGLLAAVILFMMLLFLSTMNTKSKYLFCFFLLCFISFFCILLFYCISFFVFFCIHIIHGFRSMAKLRMYFLVNMDYIASLYKKVRSPPYCCAVLLNPSLVLILKTKGNSTL